MVKVSKMNFCHRFPNLYLISSLSLLGLVILDSQSLSAAAIFERAGHKGILATDTELSKEISPSSWNAGDTLEKVEQSEPSRAEEALLCSFSNTIASRCPE